MQSFKVGDWVINKTSKQRIIKKVTSVYSDTVTVGNPTVGINVMLVKDLELWEPKLGEWCWFWNFNEMPTLEQFSKYHNLDDHLGNYETLAVKLYQHCEPFIGELPTYLKDNT